ncbi:hypothetical protein TA3x_005282 [Tundrisphaera sp. TA3]|uniref:hypothetical protein n=1 Tax=Tundrisphaera sp. TA3 TaxID=3435775 RepID=UPI003EB962F9
MHRFARTKLALVGLTVAAPLAAQAGDIPSYAKGGFRTPAQTVGLDGRVVKANPSPGAPVAPVTRAVGSAPMVMTEAQARAMPSQGRIVACAHSRNGVCPACQAVLDMPGQVTMMPDAAPSAAPAEAPGRAVASAPAAAAPGMGLASSEEGPMPIGVVRTNFSNGNAGAMGMAAPAGPASAAMSAPGRAVAAPDPMMGVSSAPYQHRRSEANPKILGHLFGWSAIGSEWRESRAFARDQARSKSRAAAAMAAMNPEATGADAIPAGMVYGPRR